MPQITDNSNNPADIRQSGNMDIPQYSAPSRHSQPAQAAQCAQQARLQQEQPADITRLRADGKQDADLPCLFIRRGQHGTKHTDQGNGKCDRTNGRNSSTHSCASCSTVSTMPVMF